MGPNADRLHRTPPPTDGGDPNAAGDPGRKGAVTIRPGTPADAAAAAALHVGGITEGFLSLLGTGFLRRLYRRITLYPKAYLLVADHERDTVGFIAGASDVPGLYRSFLIRDGVAAGWSALGPLVRDWRRVAETLRHGTPGGRGTGGAELLSVAVDPRWQGRGAARRLVASFLDEAVARGCPAAHVVVGADNQRAIALYERAGFVTSERFELHPGTESLLMRWEPGGAPPPAKAPTG
jgi:ribosomal protein S18 acetylase RimI-like enzyme